jgi:radical SAM superfamily enzyme YgiQ (UPF0313 family)
MKISLINPPCDTPMIREGRSQLPQKIRKNSTPQMTLAYLAGTLRHAGYQVLALDCIADGLDSNAVWSILSDFQPNLSLINTVTPSIESDLDFVAQLKERHPNCLTAVFGTHVTALHREVMAQCPKVDCVFRHEPEWTALELATALTKGQLPDSGLPGCDMRINGRVVEGPERPFIDDLDSLGFPAWDLFDISRYQHPVLGRSYLTVNTSRGCAHNCIFCVGSLYYGKKVRYRSVTSILDELERHVLGTFKVDLVWFYADDFTADPEFVKQLCRGILDRGLKITWWSNTRVDKPDDEMYRLMKESGCYMLSIGGESGNQEILRIIRKGTKPEFIHNTVRLLRRVDITSLVFFLIGLPGETRATIEETIRFAQKINPDYVEFYPATPFPGTAFHDISKKEGLIADADWSGYMCGGDNFVVKIPEVTREELDRILRSAYRRFYVRPAYLWLMARRLLRNPQEFVRLCIFGLGYVRRFITPQ